MVKVTFPLGSESAHGKIANAITFRGNIAQQYVAPRDPKTNAQVGVRDEFRDWTRVLSRSGIFPRAVFQREIGARWFTTLTKLIKMYSSTSSVVYETFHPAMKSEWDFYCPYIGATEGIGKSFFQVMFAIWQHIGVTMGKDWGIMQWDSADAEHARNWLVEEIAVVFQAGLHDDDDARIRYVGDWGIATESYAVEGSYHACSDDESFHAVFYFIGSVLGIVLPTFLSGGAMRVQIDDVNDAFSHLESYSAYLDKWTSVTMPDGLHTVEVRVNGLGIAAIDAIVIE